MDYNSQLRINLNSPIQRGRMRDRKRERKREKESERERECMPLFQMDKSVFNRVTLWFYKHGVNAWALYVLVVSKKFILEIYDSKTRQFSALHVYKKKI